MNPHPILNSAGKHFISGLDPRFASLTYADELGFGVGDMEKMRDYLKILEQRIEDATGESQELIRDLRRDVNRTCARAYELLRRMDLLEAEKGEL